MFVLLRQNHMFAGIIFMVSSDLVNFLGSTGIKFTSIYYFGSLKTSEIHQINPSQTSMNLQYICYWGKDC